MPWAKLFRLDGLGINGSGGEFNAKILNELKLMSVGVDDWSIYAERI